MLLGTAGALMFSAANVFFRDFGNVVSIMTMFIRFSVPMIYPYSLVDDRFGEAAKYYLCNPLADCVLLVQRAHVARHHVGPGCDREVRPAAGPVALGPRHDGCRPRLPRDRPAGLQPARVPDPGTALT